MFDLIKMLDMKEVYVESISKSYLLRFNQLIYLYYGYLINNIQIIQDDINNLENFIFYVINNFRYVCRNNPNLENMCICYSSSNKFVVKYKNIILGEISINNNLDICFKEINSKSCENYNVFLNDAIHLIKKEFQNWYLNMDKAIKRYNIAIKRIKKLDKELINKIFYLIENFNKDEFLRLYNLLKKVN